MLKVKQNYTISKGLKRVYFGGQNGLMPMKKLKYTSEIRERAVQLLIESKKDYPSNWAAVSAIAPKIGCTPETLRVWY